MKRIAVACDDDRGLESPVCAHFGRAPFYTVVEFDGETPARYTVSPNPFAGAHKPGAVPRFLRSLAPDVVISGGMGPRAIDMLDSFGIDVVTGASGSTRDVVQAYLAGSLAGITPCEHSHDGHGCGHGQPAQPNPGAGPSAAAKVVAIPVPEGNDLSATIDPRFGRASRFLLVDLDRETVVETIDNHAAAEAHGAGIAAAQLVAQKGAQAVVAGRFGPNAEAALAGLGLTMYNSPDGLSAAEVIKRLKSGQLGRQG